MKLCKVLSLDASSIFLLRNQDTFKLNLRLCTGRGEVYWIGIYSLIQDNLFCDVSNSCTRITSINRQMKDIGTTESMIIKLKIIYLSSPCNCERSTITLGWEKVSSGIKPTPLLTCKWEDYEHHLLKSPKWAGGGSPGKAWEAFLERVV